MLQLGLWCKDAQTKRTRLCPWCGDDAYALGWDVLTTQAMVGAKAAPLHTMVAVKHKNSLFAKGFSILVCLYVGYCKSDFTRINNA